jgi:hypothetical protein
MRTAYIRLYRAGVFTGETEDGSFRPEENISRAEAAQAVARMAASSMRGKVTLAKPEVFSPDLTEQASKDDEYFKDAAILGNSLVEGLKMYSKLTTINYYSGTSMSVVSASKTELPQLLGTKYAKIYIELGINEIGEDVGTFKNDYGAMIDKIKSAEPDAKSVHHGHTAGEQDQVLGRRKLHHRTGEGVQLRPL